MSAGGDAEGTHRKKPFHATNALFNARRARVRLAVEKRNDLCLIDRLEKDVVAGEHGEELLSSATRLLERDRQWPLRWWDRRSFNKMSIRFRAHTRVGSPHFAPIAAHRVHVHP